MLAVAAGMSLIGLSLGALTATEHARAAPPTLPNQAELNNPICNDIDLEISKTVNNVNPQEGEIITYTITLTNHGPDEADWIEVTDALPPGVTLLWSESTHGLYTNSVWTVENLTRQESAGLTLAVTVDPGTAGSPITNTAKISAAEPSNSASYPDEARATIMVIGADLAVSKSVHLTELDEGEVITYTVTVTNQGPDDATGVWLRDWLPGEIHITGYTATQGIYSTGLWQVGELANRATATLLMSGRLGSCAGGGIITNTASISAADQADPNDENNEASVGIVSAGEYCLYLPVIIWQPCSPADTFTNRESSFNEWPLELNDFIMDYDKNRGEYRIRTADSTSPDLFSTSKFYIAHLMNVRFYEYNYRIMADMHWQNDRNLGKEYGLVFAFIREGRYSAEQAYRFLLDVRDGDYRLERHPNPNASNDFWGPIISGNISQYVNNDFITNTNNLEIIHNDDNIHLYVNNHFITKTNDHIPEKTIQVGFGVLSQEYQVGEARFDNFVYCQPGLASKKNVDLEITDVDNLPVVTPGE